MVTYLHIDRISWLVESNQAKLETSGQSYKASMIVIYDYGVLPDLKIPHITTLEL